MSSLARTFKTGREGEVAIHTGRIYSVGTGFFLVLAEEGYSFPMQNSILQVILNSLLLTVVQYYSFLNWYFTWCWEKNAVVRNRFEKGVD